MSDHFSGPRALAGPLCDICDVYAFPSPERQSHLVLVIDLLPNAPADAFFSDAVLCRFRLRPLTISSTGPTASFAVGNESTEFTVDCSFDTPSRTDGVAGQKGRLTSSTGDAVDFTVNDENGASQDGLRVFAGPRSDPFFLDFPALQKTLVSGKLAFSEKGSLVGPAGLSEGANVLSVVVEIDCAKHLQSGGGSLFAFVGETISGGKVPVRLERVGRPEIKNLLLGPKNRDMLNRDMELRDIYNLEDAFHVGPDYRNAYRARMSANLAYLDTLDGKNDWQLDEQGTHPLTNLLLADFLVVDVSRPFSEESYFEIERAMLEGRDHTTCGARSLNENVMDTQYTLYINAGNGPGISDNVTQSTVRAGMTFPYLARANQKAFAAGRGEDEYRGKLQHHHH